MENEKMKDENQKEQIRTALSEAASQLEGEAGESLATTEDFELEDDSVITQEYFENVLMEMEKMNFVEVSKVNRELKFELNNVNKAKESIEQILKMQEEFKKSAESDNDLAKAIAEADTQEETGISDMEKFLSSYDDTVTKLNALIEKSETRIHEFDDVEKTSSYLNKCMIEVLDAKLVKLEKDTSPQFKTLAAYYRTMKDLYANRNSVDFVNEKIATKAIEINRLKISLKKDKTGSVLKNVQKKTSALLGDVFAAKQLDAFEAYINELFKDEDTAFYFQYALMLIYQTEKEHGKYRKYKWVEMLIMNVTDIIAGIYDLDGGKEDFDNKLLSLKDVVNSIINKKK